MEREENALYQNGELVGRVVGPDIDEANRKIRFQEIHGADWLLIPDECEYQKYRIVIDKVEYATKESQEAVQKGRILRDIEADITSFGEQ